MAWFDDDEFDPQTYAGQGEGGLLGRLLAVNPGLASGGAAGSDTEAPSDSPQPSSPTNAVATDENGRPLRRVYITSPPVAPDQSTDAQNGSAPSDISSSANSPYDAQTYDSQGGLLGRLLALQAEQSRYQPVPDRAAQPSLPQTGNSQRSSVPRATGPSNAGGIELDPIDIGKSLGAGVANGAISGLGFPADVLTGFGYLPPHQVENSIRRKFGYSDLSQDEQGWIDTFTSDQLRHDFENHVVPLHQPETRLGRYAETIGEMAPMAMGWGSALREWPAIVLKHAVAPGAVVQTLQEEFPESKAGKALQKAYPVARKVVPYLPAVTRYLGKRIVPY
jgi:hypothetical protein